MKPEPLRFVSGGQQEPGQQGRVAICFAVIGRAAEGDVRGGRGEDIVVNVGIREWRVSILVETVEKQYQAESDCGSKDFGNREESGHAEGAGVDLALEKYRRPAIQDIISATVDRDGTLGYLHDPKTVDVER